MTPRGVYLHGFLGAPEAWEVVTALAGEVSARCPTLPGHGRDPWMPPGDFIGVIDAIAARELPASGDDPVILVGYSLGARVALGLALRHPKRVARAVLVGVAPGLDDPDARGHRARSDEALALSVERDGVAAFVAAWEALALFDTQRALAPERLAAQQRWRNEHTARGVAWSLRTLGLAQQPAWGAALAQSPVAIELVTGERDEKFTALARPVARGAVTHTVVPGVGHNVALEAPEALAAIVRGRP